MSRTIAYYRVSTSKQGASGLGLEAQRAAVAAHIQRTAGELVAEYIEVESGCRSDRPQLTAALADARLRRATVVISKLDRLARNVSFIASLMDAGVEFVALDCPAANRLTLHILAAVAEAEARLISERTKAALAAAKARGTKLGGFRGRVATNADRAAGRARQSENAGRFARDLAPILHSLAAAGIKTASGLAKSLNEQGVPTSRGALWTAVQVGRMQKRLAASTHVQVA